MRSAHSFAERPPLLAQHSIIARSGEELEQPSNLILTALHESKQSTLGKEVFPAYRGDPPQLTLRSAITGFLLGGVLAATNLYVAGKTGIALGVGLTSLILALAMFRLLARVRLARISTILENNNRKSVRFSFSLATT